MPELRKDPVTGLWVIISTDRRKRPGEFRREPVKPMAAGEFCPFDAGHESATRPEILAYRDGTAPNTTGWHLRVVPNMFPALQVEGGLDRVGEGMFDRMNGVGAHEVIIETPNHDETLSTMPGEAVERVVTAYRDRVLDLRQDRRFRYIVVFKNVGVAAGATLDHSHSQLVALPVVPRQVRDEVDGAARHFAEKERCVFCDIVRQELAEGTRVIAENGDMVAIAPYASRFPFETWIVPKRHGARFEEAPRHEFGALARLIRDVLGRMRRMLDRPAYNLVVNNSPFGEDVGEYYHWHVEIMPRLTRVAGFEWGTGFYINPTSPEEAARVLRNVRAEEPPKQA